MTGIQNWYCNAHLTCTFSIAIFLFVVREENKGLGRNDVKETSKEKEKRHTNKQTKKNTLKKGGTDPFGRVGSTADYIPKPRVHVWGWEWSVLTFYVILFSPPMGT